MAELAARLVDTLVGVRSEVIALRLQQIRGQPLCAIAIEKCQRRGEGRRRHAHLNRMSQRLTPRCLILVHRAEEEAVKQQIGKFRILVERVLDLAQERDRIMQPPRHISAMPPMFRFQPFSLAAALSSM